MSYLFSHRFTSPRPKGNQLCVGARHYETDPAATETLRQKGNSKNSHSRFPFEPPLFIPGYPRHPPSGVKPTGFPRLRCFSYTINLDHYRNLLGTNSPGSDVPLKSYSLQRRTEVNQNLGSLCFEQCLLSTALEITPGPFGPPRLLASWAMEPPKSSSR